MKIEPSFNMVLPRIARFDRLFMKRAEGLIKLTGMKAF